MARAIPQAELLWALGSICALHRRPFSAELVERAFPPPHTCASLTAAGRALGLRIKPTKLKRSNLDRMAFPLLVGLAPAQDADAPSPSLGILTAATDGKVVFFRASGNQAETLSGDSFLAISSGDAWLAAPQGDSVPDADAVGTTRRFGFRWFVPELLRHRKVWRDVLLASLALQLIALATPLFTQAIIDKVVVHRTQSTLIAIGVAMAIFMVFSSLLSWVRQYLVLRTGPRSRGIGEANCWCAHRCSTETDLLGRIYGQRYAYRRATGGARRSLLVRSVMLGLALLFVTACQAKSEDSDKEKMPLSELLCIYTPISCHGKRLLDLYGAPPGAIYERQFRDQVLHIPTGYISDTELLVDPRYPKASSSLYLVALLPDLKPRDRSNLKEFFVPYDWNLISINVVPRGPSAMPWEEGRQMAIRFGGEMLSRVRRPDKHGLEAFGEDFDRYPKRRPCETLDTDLSTCKSPHARDILRPIQQEGERSLMFCDPDILPDVRAKLATMTNTEREAWYASKAWFGVRNAMCRHELYYQPLNSLVVLRYQRHFISQWERTEQLVRELLDHAQVPGTAAVPLPATNHHSK